MFAAFFYLLRQRGLHVSLNEWMTLLEGMEKGLHHSTLTGFYHLCRAIVVKNETEFDRLGAFTYSQEEDTPAARMEDQVEEFIRQDQNVDIESPKLTVGDRMNYAKNQVVSTVKKVAPYIFVGVAIGAAIHNLIPEHIVRSILGEQKWYAVPLATVVGVPMYADIFGTIPVAESLLAKGAGLGTILAFMMSVTTISFPSLVMLSKAIKKKLLGTFIGIVCVGIIIVGYLFNIFGYMLL